jgi:4-hydroxybenzoyl-CoA thioesterase
MSLPLPDHPPAFETEIPIRFQHCDPAGIVFYPRFFEFTNQVVEQWFEEALGVGFRDLHQRRGLGVPTVHVEADFRAPMRLGDRGHFQLHVLSLGRSRIELAVTGRLGETVCLVARGTLAMVTMDPMAGTAIPEDLRAAMAAHLPPAEVS